MLNRLIFVCQPDQQSRLLPEKITCVCSQPELDLLLEENRDLSATGFIILAELKWENRYYSDFSGIDILYQLRVLHHLTSPIILTSFVPYLFEHFQAGVSTYPYHNKLRVFKDPSIAFYCITDLLKLDFKELIKYFHSGLDHYFLKDLQENVYRVDGYVKSFLQNLRNELRALSFPLNREDLIEFYRERCQLLSKNLPEVEKIEFQSFNIPKQRRLFTLKEALEHNYELSNIIALEFQDHTGLSQSVITPIKTIYVSNDAALQEGFRSGIDKFDIKIFSARTYSALKEILQQQEDIGVIVCDFRFLEEDGRLSWEQGYHLYDRLLRESKEIYEFIFLTNFNQERFPRHLHRENITPFPKDQLRVSRLGYVRLAQLILEKDRLLKDKYEQLFIFETAQELYLLHKQSSDFLSWEDKTTEFVEQILERIRRGEKEHLPIIENISGSIQTKKEATNLQNFRNKLKARRLALGLFQFPPSLLLNYRDEQEHWIIICALLRTGSLNKKGAIGKTHSFMNKHLLKLKTKRAYRWDHALDPGLQLTREERIWLQNFGNRHQLANPQAPFYVNR